LPETTVLIISHRPIASESVGCELRQLTLAGEDVSGRLVVAV
jgi:hypothetical protein